MGAATVLDLKDERFTCQKPCTHRDCMANRLEWEGAICGICGKPMLPGQRYFYASETFEDDKYIKFQNQPGYKGKPHMHAVCYQEEIEKDLKGI